ncbi:unnamed protein product [Schistosoma margrebowiei]|uniref:Uncharacterized protein n=1 Tax=Schistosoma margrebowiei TaxID=48269 RepID=A0A183N4B0_9TREM|nr:unnamed protein product [Schistosoma margrebowiei]
MVVGGSRQSIGVATAFGVWNVELDPLQRLIVFGISLVLFTSALMIGAAIKTDLADHIISITIFLMAISVVIVTVAVVLNRPIIQASIERITASICADMFHPPQGNIKRGELNLPNRYEINAIELTYLPEVHSDFITYSHVQVLFNVNVMLNCSNEFTESSSCFQSYTTGVLIGAQISMFIVTIFISYLTVGKSRYLLLYPNYSLTSIFLYAVFFSTLSFNTDIINVNKNGSSIFQFQMTELRS